MNQNAYFVGGLRTPFTRFSKGAYKDTPPEDLLITLFRESTKENPELLKPEDVIVGCAYPEGEQGYNIARVASLGVGFESPGVTVNRLCGSSLEAVTMAAARIKSGWGNCYLAGGVEAMSRVPRRGANFYESDLVKETCPEAFVTMGETAENIAKQFPISREAQEEFAFKSHELSYKAWEDGKYDNQVLKYKAERDESIRYPVNKEKMKSLPPAFGEGGVVTAATSSPLSDGAACGWVVSEGHAQKLGCSHGVEILDASVSHTSPEVMGLGPVDAIKKLFTRNNLKADDIDVYELNEAFAIQILACASELDLPMDKVNRWGGALALGHPLGASGLRLMITVRERLHQLQKKDGLGIVSLCVGGGQGIAVLCRYKSF